MLIQLGPKGYQPLTRIAVQFVLMVTSLYFIFLIIYPSFNYLAQISSINAPFKIWGLAILLTTFNVIALLQLLYLPFWVTIDEDSKTLTVKYLTIPVKIVNIKDIIGYSNAIINSRFSSADGIIVQLPKNKKILLSELTLDDFRVVERFLDASKITKLGEESFSIFFIVNIQQYK